MLLSSATIYLTYRPYWYIFQRTIFKGDRSRIHDLRYFLEAARVPPGTRSQNYFSLLSLPFYFWTGVTLLGLIGLALILLRHLRARPQASAST